MIGYVVAKDPYTRSVRNAILYGFDGNGTIKTGATKKVSTGSARVEFERLWFCDEVQHTPSKTGSSLSFGVNLGLVGNADCTRDEAQRKPKFPGYIRCPYRWPLSHDKDVGDKWWGVKSEAHAERAIADVRTCATGFANDLLKCLDNVANLLEAPDLKPGMDGSWPSHWVRAHA